MQKLCECGCGGLAPICKHTNKKLGYVQGQPLRFITGHHLKGKHLSEETKRKMSESRKGNKHYMFGKHHSLETRKKISKNHADFSGEKNPRWKGGKKISALRRKNNLKYILNNRMRANIRKSLKIGTKNKRHWEDLVGYSVKQLKKRLESTMPDGYSWTDFLSGELQVDHIVPISAHNFTSTHHQDFLRCWALSNLQLLTVEENSKKRARLNEPFQPSFKF